MAGSLRSPLAPWIGGAAAPSATVGGFKSLLAPWMGGAAAPSATVGGFKSLLAPWMGGASATDTTGCFFNGEFYGAGFFCGGTPAATTATVTPAGRHKKRRAKQRVMIGDRLYEVETLQDVEFILKRLVRSEAEPVTEAAKARVRVVDRVSTRVEESAPVALQMASVEVDWSSLWAQLAIQDRAYAMVLEKVLARQEEDDIEAILMALN